MRPQRFDFELWTNGDYTEELSFQVRDTYFDISGHSFRAQIRQTPNAVTALSMLLTVASPVEQGFCLVEPAAGALQVRFLRGGNAAIFDAVSPSALIGDRISVYYDAVATLPSGDEEPWLYGYINIIKGITNG